MLRVLCVGDVVGRPGREIIRARLPLIQREHQIDFTVVNGENSAGGLGIDGGTAKEIFQAGANVITLGDHTWDRKEARTYLDQADHTVIRPANYPVGAPGRGWVVVTGPRGIKIAVVNLLGRVFMNGALDCPYHKVEALLESELRDATVRICDMHAEATSEKVAMGRFLDGRFSVVVGTHTHIQTADEVILPQGTAYLTDMGMTGPTESVIGMDIQTALKRLRTGLPAPYAVGDGPRVLQGLITDIDETTGKALAVKRIRDFWQAP